MKVIPISLRMNKRSVRFYKIFLSYLLLVVFSLFAIGSVVYVNIISALQKEVEQVQLSNATQVRDTLDTRFRELQRIALLISSNPLLSPYQLSQYGYDSYQAVEELKKYHSSNSFIHNVILNYAASSAPAQRLFSATGVFEEAEFFRHIYRYAGWGHVPMREVIRSLNGPVIRPVETVLTSNGTQESKYATYLYPLPAYSGKPYGVVMFMLDAGMLQSLTEQLVSRPGAAFYLLDERGNTIFSTSREQAGRGLPEADPGSIRLLTDSAGTDSASVHSLKGIKYSVIRQELTYNGWRLVTLVPASQLLEKVEQSRRLFGGIMLAVLAAGAATSFVLANSNYKKLRQLVQLFSDKKENGTPKEDGTTDELVYLSKAIRQLSGQESMMFKLNSKKGLIRENVLLSLFKNKTQAAEELEHSLELAEVKWEYGHFISVLLVIDDYASFQAAYSGSMQELFKFCMLNAAEELSMEMGRGYGVSMLDDRGIALVLNIRHSGDYKKQLQTFAENLQAFFHTYYKFTLSAGIGRLYEELGAVGDSYEEARKALHYRFITGNQAVLFYEDVQSRMNEQSARYPHEMEDRLLKSIRQGNMEEAENAVRLILLWIRSQAAAPEAAQLATIGLLHLLIKLSEEILPFSPDELYPDSLSLSPHHMETIDMLEKRMIGICRRMCEHVSGRKESRNVKLRDDILVFLQERYADSSLTLESIADHFEMSASYITRFVKDQTGYSLIRYLDLLRMDKAKQLLLSGSLNLSEITREVGYVDVSNFIRKFKKAEGVTPEQYRKLREKD